MADATAPKAEATQKKVPKGAKEYQAVILAEDMSEDMSKDAVSYMFDLLQYFYAKPLSIVASNQTATQFIIFPPFFCICR